MGEVGKCRVDEARSELVVDLIFAPTYLPAQPHTRMHILTYIRIRSTPKRPHLEGERRHHFSGLHQLGRPNRVEQLGLLLRRRGGGGLALGGCHRLECVCMCVCEGGVCQMSGGVWTSVYLKKKSLRTYTMYTQTRHIHTYISQNIPAAAAAAAEPAAVDGTPAISRAEGGAAPSRPSA